MSKEKETPKLKLGSKLPHLVTCGRSKGLNLYTLKNTLTRFGCSTEVEPRQDFFISGTGIEDEHCIFELLDKTTAAPREIILHPIGCCHLNEVEVEDSQSIHHNDKIRLGDDLELHFGYPEEVRWLGKQQIPSKNEQKVDAAVMTTSEPSLSLPRHVVILPGTPTTTRASLKHKLEVLKQAKQKASNLGAPNMQVSQDVDQPLCIPQPEIKHTNIEINPVDFGSQLEALRLEDQITNDEILARRLRLQEEMDRRKTKAHQEQQLIADERYAQMLMAEDEQQIEAGAGLSDSMIESALDEINQIANSSNFTVTSDNLEDEIGRRRQTEQQLQADEEFARMLMGSSKNSLK